MFNLTEINMATMTFSNFRKIIAIFLILCAISFTACARKSNGPVVLDENSWTQLLHGEWMVDFHAPWCPACKSLEPEWKKFADWSDDLEINVATADVTVNPGLSGRFMVSGLPTIYHVKDGVFRLYTGSRKHDKLIDFIEKHGYKAIEPVSRLWAPDSLQMSFVAYSFRISMLLRDLHNYLVEDVGLPNYLSYLIFALGTVMLGSALGIVIVFIIDQFYPSRYASASQDLRRDRSVAKKKKTDETSDSDLDDTNDDDDRMDATKSDPNRKSMPQGVKKRSAKS